jgi:hypothetical protein
MRSLLISNLQDFGVKKHLLCVHDVHSLRRVCVRWCAVPLCSLGAALSVRLRCTDPPFLGKSKLRTATSSQWCNSSCVVGHSRRSVPSAIDAKQAKSQRR